MVSTTVSRFPKATFWFTQGTSRGVGSLESLAQAARWLGQQPFNHRVSIAGNHDWCFERAYERRLARRVLSDHGITYLEDEAATIDGVKFYGSPWQPRFYDWAFNLPRGSEKLRIKWAAIPDQAYE